MRRDGDVLATWLLPRAFVVNKELRNAWLSAGMQYNMCCTPEAPLLPLRATQILLRLFPTKMKTAPADADVVLTAGRAGSG